MTEAKKKGKTTKKVTKKKKSDTISTLKRMRTKIEERKAKHEEWSVKAEEEIRRVNTKIHKAEETAKLRESKKEKNAVAKDFITKVREIRDHTNTPGHFWAEIVGYLSQTDKLDIPFSDPPTSEDALAGLLDVCTGMQTTKGEKCNIK